MRPAKRGQSAEAREMREAAEAETDEAATTSTVVPGMQFTEWQMEK